MLKLELFVSIINNKTGLEDFENFKILYFNVEDVHKNGFNLKFKFYVCPTTSI
jgi:hypothetical protein